MNTHFAQQQLVETCRHIGAIFTYEEAEGGAWCRVPTGMRVCGWPNYTNCAVTTKF